MRVLVVYAHPSPNSFAAAVVMAGHQVDDLDLYAEEFQPVLTREEREVHYNAGGNFTGVAAMCNACRADALVLCFPTWWYGMPAILKGWFDRVRSGDQLQCVVVVHTALHARARQEGPHARVHAPHRIRGANAISRALRHAAVDRCQP